MIQKEAIETGGSKKHVVSSDSYQSFIRFSLEPAKWVEEKQMDPWFEDSMLMEGSLSNIICMGATQFR